MNRLVRSGWLLPIALAVAGVALIIAGRLQDDGAGRAGPSAGLSPAATEDPSLSPSVAFPTLPPTGSPTPEASPTPSASPTASPPPTPTPSPTLPPDLVAQRLEIPSVGIALPVRQATEDAVCAFPPADAAFVLCDGAQPGRGTNSYIFAHALLELFKPLWNVRLGAEVLVTMTDGRVLRYVVTEVRPNVPCPDADPPNPELNPAPGDLPPALLNAPPDCNEGVRWTQPTATERLTLQTSQGYNRNWGEFVVIAEPVAG